MILSRDIRHMSCDKYFCRKHCRMVLRHLFLRIKVKVSVFLVLWVCLTACNICHRRISQNIARLRYIDLCGNIFKPYDNKKYFFHMYSWHSEKQTILLGNNNLHISVFITVFFMNNSKAYCSQSKKKFQMNKDLLKIRLPYKFNCIYHPFLLLSKYNQ